ncbi:MAG: GNAT family N-acetyltransferase [Candidatus Peregrinibacteria bacterium]|nr:GNAT family N-acetyltransferase [Candidatus Peregrinibacteria bacterium]
MIAIRPYMADDHPVLVEFMIELQGHIASLDPLGRVRSSQDFDAEVYLEHLLSLLKSESGFLFIAEEYEALLGFIAGSIPKDAEEDLLDHYPVREGKIHELAVSESHREKGIGRLLMEKIEEQFRSQGCEYIRVGCFAPNTGAHAFYKKNGYDDRYTEMLKRL